MESMLQHLSLTRLLEGAFAGFLAGILATLVIGFTRCSIVTAPISKSLAETIG